MATISKRGRKSHQQGRPVKTVDQLKRLYERQKDRISAITLTTESGEVEQWKHCLDTESFGGACYCPSFVISSFGRVWNLDEGDNGNLKTLTSSKAKRDQVEGYLKIHIPQAGKAREINPNKNVYIHVLVANYFCDLDHEQRSLMIEKGRATSEKDLSVHHISLNRLGKKYVNKWDNLQYLGKKYHKAIHDLLKANMSKNEETKAKARKRFNKKYGELSNDPLMLAILNAYAKGTNKDNRLSITYRRLSENEIEELTTEDYTVDPIVENITVTQKFDKKQKPMDLVEPKNKVLRSSVGLDID